MKIPLKVGTLFPREERTHPLVFMVIKLHKYPSIRILTNALVDTGSYISSISPRDILKTRIPYGALRPASPPSTRIGGFVLPVFDLDDVTLFFRNDVGERVSIETSAMKVLGVPPKREGIEHIPTIIGTDFLEDNGFTLVFNPSKREAYLEKQG